ncbi:transposase [Streptomyces mirabilis]|uniref:transposase n=1 Tax=Streptomyces mirabilis TaxID=68239 RepID=UPI00331D4412
MTEEIGTASGDLIREEKCARVEQARCSCRSGRHPRRPSPHASGVIDRYLETATTTSAPYDLLHAEHGKKAAGKLARHQREMARRKPKRGQAASKNYQKAKRQTAKVHKKIARQRQDSARKWARKVTTDFDQIAVEDFRPRFLAKSTMAREAADAAISATRRELINMARKHGRIVHLVHPAHTTMDRVMLVRAGLDPAGADRSRPDSLPRNRAA